MRIQNRTSAVNCIVTDPAPSTLFPPWKDDNFSPDTEQDRSTQSNRGGRVIPQTLAHAAGGTTSRAWRPAAGRVCRVGRGNAAAASAGAWIAGGAGGHAGRRCEGAGRGQRGAEMEPSCAESGGLFGPKKQILIDRGGRAGREVLFTLLSFFSGIEA